MKAASDNIGVGGPASRRLREWGNRLYEAWDHMPYLVGSAAKGKEWRDVDVRIIIPDQTFLLVFRSLKKPLEMIPRWSVVCDALSAWGEQVTGLPIDCQIQPQSLADEFDGPRHALFLLHGLAELGDAAALISPSPKEEK